MPKTLRVLALAALLVVAACGGGDDSGDSDTPGFFTDLASVYSADNVDDRFYGITVTFNGNSDRGQVIAEVIYPGFDCIGTWTLTEIDGMEVSATERISIDPGDACTNDGRVELRRNGEMIAYKWYYPSGGLSDTATLDPG